MINPIDGSCLVYAGNPTRLAKLKSNELANSEDDQKAKSSGENGHPHVDRHSVGTKLWGQVLGTITKLPENVGKKPGPGFIIFPPPSTAQKLETCIELNAVDLRDNKTATIESQKKDCTMEQKQPTILLSKGKNFQIDLYFYRPFNVEVDYLDLYLEQDDGKIRLPIKIEGIRSKKIDSPDNDQKHRKLSTGASKRKHSADPVNFVQGRLVQMDGHKLTTEILPKSSDIVQNGMWRLGIITANKKDAESNEFDYFVDGILIG